MARKRKNRRRGKKPYYNMTRRSGRVGVKAKSRRRSRGGGGGARGSVALQSGFKSGINDALWVLLGAMLAKLGVGYFSAEDDPASGVITEKAEVSPVMILLGALAPGVAGLYWNRDKGRLILAGGVALAGMELLFPKVIENLRGSELGAVQRIAVGSGRPITLDDFGYSSGDDSPPVFVYDNVGAPADFAIGAGEDFAIGGPADFAIGGGQGLGQAFEY